MRRARDSRAVLKLRLAAVRAKSAQVPILIFEGKEDVPVYIHWIRRVVETAVFEPFIAGSKSKSLQLLSSVREDAGELGKAVFFFVDRDFDDLQGLAPGNDIFVTDRYSIESYLCTREVVECFCVAELECAGSRDTIQKLLAAFDADFDTFLESTREVNLRLFAARLHGLRVITKPEKIGELVEVEIGSVRTVADFDASALIPTDPPLEETHIDAARAEFDELVPILRYRGKFTFMFFVRWLNQLCAERRRPDSKHFQGCTQVSKLRTDHDSKPLLAARSPLPIGFSAFVGAIFQ